ncbi:MULTISPECIES: hypothetical protein [unclassified Streptomyces]|uniref:hypothetical protein n=1 Tax=unclassified Streptomyces TaxID=2593676 RepID=UPI0011C7DDA9|nr:MULTISPECIES: hypothetical protein [unclassified Streptomyces]TXS17249.1 hypothetical protein EAO68_05330 [Streptomyces sp. wa22]WSQ79017.1 hypothetical protein OG725_18770 [Streptomyces sp. NBC_01213]WSQ86386.1 hypothetical protein OG722_19380 [Streptomyces sp. NBC_01212]
MTNPDFNPWIFALLCDSDFQPRKDTGTWSHRDGRPFSKEEQALADSATRAEVEELSAQHTRYKKYVHEICDAPDVTQRFLAPFMEQLTEKKLGNAVELMSEDEVAEFNRLLALADEPIRPFTPYAF